MSYEDISRAVENVKRDPLKVIQRVAKLESDIEIILNSLENTLLNPKECHTRSIETIVYNMRQGYPGKS